MKITVNVSGFGDDVNLSGVGDLDTIDGLLFVYDKKGRMLATFNEGDWNYWKRSS